jgi:anthranilate synthase component 1
MNNLKLITESRKLLADTLTPVNIYLKLRDVYAGSLLLESSDYHGQENSLSIICCEPRASFQVVGKQIEIRYPGRPQVIHKVDHREQVILALDEFRKSFLFNEADLQSPAAGLFGYINYDAVQFFEDIKLSDGKKTIPDICYQLFRYVIVIDHFSNELILFENRLDHQEPSGLKQMEQIIFSNKFSTFPFQAKGNRSSNLTDAQYLDMVNQGIHHCLIGDVFQIVLSRRFEQEFQGDEFNVYRALRSINPSPYLFYFDFVGYKIFGSSPEAQLQVKDGIASIYPIAGTFRRTGNDADDAILAEKLSADEKENAEHLMLVDLARNDLSRSATQVTVEVLKEIQYYSHVIHLVSKVSGKLPKDAISLQLLADTFPAGTLSGAPKHKAMTLIEKIEGQSRGYYGGAIGFMGCNGNINHAIMIRTFLSLDNKLICQAGAGIVARSNPEQELAEVNNKLEALRKAVHMAEKI